MSDICQELKKRERPKRRNSISRNYKETDYKIKNKSDSSILEIVESGEILSITSEWNLGSYIEFFVTCLNDDSDKIGKLINNFLGY